MKRVLLLALLPVLGAAPARAQPADPHAGHVMPAKPPVTPPADPHAGHLLPAAKAPSTGADLPVGTDTPPPPPEPAADAVYGAAPMDRARVILRREHGGARVSQVMLSEAEISPGSGGAYRWNGEAWFGDDHNRFVLKTEGEGARRGGVEAAEVQALWSRPVGPYADLQLGLRHDVRPTPSRTYLTAGFETLLPYWIEAEGAVFLSDKGDLLARLEGAYDLRLTQVLVLQPRAELNFAAQDDRARGVGSGLSESELGLRLRYEIRRQFAPYVGVVWTRRHGASARFARAQGEDPSAVDVVVGLRGWF